VGSQDDVAAGEESSEEEDELETPAQKRLRLSQMYLKSLEKDKEGEFLHLVLLEESLLTYHSRE
jgi:ribosomal RNA-processing protein 9